MRYEVSAALIGAKVEVAYDPMCLDTVTVRYPGIEPIQAEQLTIGEYCDPKPAIPVSMLPVEPQTSRMLDVLEKKHSARQQIQDKLLLSTDHLEDTAKGLLVIDENNMTTVDGVFAVGDVVTGPLTVVHAVEGAKQAAESMMRYMEDAPKR